MNAGKWLACTLAVIVAGAVIARDNWATAKVVESQGDKMRVELQTEICGLAVGDVVPLRAKGKPKAAAGDVIRFRVDRSEQKPCQCDGLGRLVAVEVTR